MSDWPGAPPDFDGRLRAVGSFKSRFAATGIPMDRTSVTWPVANLAIFQPFQLSEPLRTATLLVLNGAVVNGNIDIGIYDAFGIVNQGLVPGTRLLSTGSVAQAGVNVEQGVGVISRRLPAGIYFFGMAMDNNVGQIIRVNDASFIKPMNTISNTLELAAAFPLPVTPATATSSSRDTPLNSVLFRFLDL